MVPGIGGLFARGIKTGQGLPLHVIFVSRAGNARQRPLGTFPATTVALRTTAYDLRGLGAERS